MSKLLDKKLDEFTDVCEKISKFENKNENIFKQYKTLLELRTELESQLKEIARDEGSTENDKVKVKVIEVYKKWYDFKIVQKLAAPKEMEELFKNDAIITEVDKDIFNKLVKEGKVRADIQQKAFKEEKMTSKVNVSLKE